MNTSNELAKSGPALRAKTNGSMQRQTRVPLVDVYESADELLLVADMPGMTPDEVAIKLDQDELTIESHRAAAADAKPLVSEFAIRDYKRTFTVPQGYDLDNVTAEFSTGVLFLHVPKSPAIKPREIRVKAG